MDRLNDLLLLLVKDFLYSRDLAVVWHVDAVVRVFALVLFLDLIMLYELLV